MSGVCIEHAAILDAMDAGDVTGRWPRWRPISTPYSRRSSGSPGSIAAISSTEGMSMAVIERVEILMVDLAAEGEADRRDPVLRQPGDADRPDLGFGRRRRHRLQLHDRHRRPRRSSSCWPDSCARR